MSAKQVAQKAQNAVRKYDYVVAEMRRSYTDSVMRTVYYYRYQVAQVYSATREGIARTLVMRPSAGTVSWVGPDLVVFRLSDHQCVGPKMHGVEFDTLDEIKRAIVEMKKKLDALGAN
jgi:hypothetical protein